MRGATPEGITIRKQQPADLPAIQTLIETAWHAVELAGRSQRDIDRWIEGLPDQAEATLVAVEGSDVVGAIWLDWSTLIVARPRRRRGIGRALIEAALAEEPDLEMSLPHNNPGAESFLRAVGFRFDHFLRQMRLDPAASPAAPEIPIGFLLRSYDDAFFDQYFQLVNQTFADHPTPVQVPESRMRAVHGRPDFDPSLIALIATADDQPKLVAFTFLRTPAVENGLLSGSIGMVGVDRDYRRLGLGRQLLRWGIQRLRQAGCEAITLEVVDTNQRALPLSEQEGFVPDEAWPYWSAAQH
jgi:mycothiol synthase